MAPELRRLRADKPVADLLAALDEDGAVVIEDLLDGATLARLNAEVEPALAVADPGMKHLNPAIAYFFGNFRIQQDQFIDDADDLRKIFLLQINALQVPQHAR